VDIFVRTAENLRFLGGLFIYWIKEIGFIGFLDITIMVIFIYTFLIWFKKTRAAFVLKGIFIVAAIYLRSVISN